MGALMRAIDWSQSAVGPVDQWPQSLRTALSILLETGFPMYIAWGRDFTQFYNDGYRPILGSTKHPAAMGSSTRDDLRRDLEHHRADVRGRHAWDADDARRLHAAARSPRLRRGVLLHLLVQPDPRRRGRRRRRARDGDRDHRARPRPSGACRRCRSWRRRRRTATAPRRRASPPAACSRATWPMCRRRSSTSPTATASTRASWRRPASRAARRSAPRSSRWRTPRARWPRALVLPIAQPGSCERAGLLVAATSERLIVDAKYKTLPRARGRADRHRGGQRARARGGRRRAPRRWPSSIAPRPRSSEGTRAPRRSRRPRHDTRPGGPRRVRDHGLERLDRDVDRDAGARRPRPAGRAGSKSAFSRSRRFARP